MSYASVQGERIYSFQNLNSIYIFTFIHFFSNNFSSKEKASITYKKIGQIVNDLAYFPDLTLLLSENTITFVQKRFRDIFQKHKL